MRILKFSGDYHPLFCLGYSWNDVRVSSHVTKVCVTPSLPWGSSYAPESWDPRLTPHLWREEVNLLKGKFVSKRQSQKIRKKKNVLNKCIFLIKRKVKESSQRNKFKGSQRKFIEKKGRQEDLSSFPE